MKHGITVWLDVPLEALARRIAAVGTDSRPLLHQESGDAYTKVAINLVNLTLGVAMVWLGNVHPEPDLDLNWLAMKLEETGQVNWVLC